MLDNKKYEIIKIGDDVDVILLKENNYINATKFCRKNGKDFYDWQRLNNTKDIIFEVENIINKPSIIKITTKDNISRGSYVHPYLLTHIGGWISPKFQVNVLHWIGQWEKFNLENSLLYNREITNLKVLENTNTEKKIRDELHNNIGGKIEVKTPAGKIDLLTKEELIEIKEYNNWKCGIWQLIAYGNYKKGRKLCLYLFAIRSDKRINKVIQNVCDKNNIKLIIKLIK